MQKYYYCLYESDNDRILKVTDDIDCLSNESFYNGSFELGKFRSIPDYIFNHLMKEKTLFFNYLEVDLIDGLTTFNRFGEKI